MSMERLREFWVRLGHPTLTGHGPVPPRADLPETELSAEDLDVVVGGLERVWAVPPRDVIPPRADV